MNNRGCPIDELYKFNAYREIASNYNAARDLLYQKKLAYGEAAVVPFYYPDVTAESKTIELMMGIGALQGNVMIYSNILGNETHADDAQVYVSEMGGNQTIADALAYIITKTNNDSSIYTALVDIKDSIDTLTSTLADKLDAIANK